MQTRCMPAPCVHASRYTPSISPTERCRVSAGNSKPVVGLVSHSGCRCLSAPARVWHHFTPLSPESVDDTTALQGPSRRAYQCYTIGYASILHDEAGGRPKRLRCIQHAAGSLWLMTVGFLGSYLVMIRECPSSRSSPSQTPHSELMYCWRASSCRVPSTPEQR